MRRHVIFIILGVITFFSLFLITRVEVNAAIPRDDIPMELDLEVVSAPNYQSSPCPISNQKPSDGKIDHAAHHPVGGGTGVAPVPLNEEARLEAVKQLTESQDYVSNLIQKMNSGMK